MDRSTRLAGSSCRLRTARRIIPAPNPDRLSATDRLSRSQSRKTAARARACLLGDRSSATRSQSCCCKVPSFLYLKRMPLKHSSANTTSHHHPILLQIDCKASSKLIKLQCHHNITTQYKPVHFHFYVEASQAHPTTAPKLVTIKSSIDLVAMRRSLGPQSGEIASSVNPSEEASIQVQPHTLSCQESRVICLRIS